MTAFIDKLSGVSRRKIVEYRRSCARANPHRIHDEGSSFSSKRIKGKTIERIAKDMSETRPVGVRDQFGCLYRQKTRRTNTRNNFVNARLLEGDPMRAAILTFFSPGLLTSHVSSLNLRNVIFQPGANSGIVSRLMLYTFGSKDNELRSYFSPVVEWFYDPSIYSKMGNNKEMTSHRVHRDPSL